MSKGRIQTRSVEKETPLTVDEGREPGAVELTSRWTRGRLKGTVGVLSRVSYYDLCTSTVFYDDGGRVPG